MAPEDLSTTTRSRILDCTVRLIMGTPAEEITTRKIAAEAGVNVAAVNYHFRSKDELIDRAIEAATASAFAKGLAVLLAPDRRPRDRLRDFITGYAHGLMVFSWMTRTAFLTLFEGGDKETVYARYLKEMLRRVGEVIAEARGRPANGEDSATALMVLSCVIFPFLVATPVREADGIDYADEAARRDYIETVLTRLVG